jgi:hypothetical protein
MDFLLDAAAIGDSCGRASVDGHVGDESISHGEAQLAERDALRGTSVRRIDSPADRAARSASALVLGGLRILALAPAVQELAWSGVRALFLGDLVRGQGASADQA